MTLPSAQKVLGIVYLNEAVEPESKFLFAAKLAQLYLMIL